LFFLAGSDGAAGAAWQQRRLRPCQLFLVGDPKQAIYRFRGADLATYLMVRNAIETQFPDNILRVTANFRSRPHILEHINGCFAGPLAAQQAGYVALQGTRDDADHGFPSVAKVSVDLLPNTRIDTSRDEEARVVAEICSRLIGNVELKLAASTGSLQKGNRTGRHKSRYSHQIPSSPDAPPSGKPQTIDRRKLCPMRIFRHASATVAFASEI
jgi:CRISPR-associated exonuclease Cas4